MDRVQDNDKESESSSSLVSLEACSSVAEDFGLSEENGFDKETEGDNLESIPSSEEIQIAISQIGSRFPNHSIEKLIF